MNKLVVLLICVVAVGSLATAAPCSSREVTAACAECFKEYVVAKFKTAVHLLATEISSWLELIKAIKSNRYCHQ